MHVCSSTGSIFVTYSDNHVTEVFGDNDFGKADHLILFQWMYVVYFFPMAALSSEILFFVVDKLRHQSKLV